MNNEEKAKVFLAKFYENRPNEIFEKFDDNSKGIFVILRLLEQSTDKIYSGDISRKLHFTTPRVAAALKTLEKKGYIERYVSRRDARRTVVVITEVGKNALKERENKLLRFVEELIDVVGEEDMNELLRIMIKLQNAITSK